MKVTQQQENKVDSYIQLMEQVRDFRETYPKLYGILRTEVLWPDTSRDRKEKKYLPKELIRYKALWEYITDLENLKPKK